MYWEYHLSAAVLLHVPMALIPLYGCRLTIHVFPNTRYVRICNINACMGVIKNVPWIVSIGMSPLVVGYLGLLLRVRVPPVDRSGVHQAEGVPGVQGGQRGRSRQGALVLRGL